MSITIANIVNISIYGMAFLLGIFGAVLGIIRGLNRQTIRLVSVILSAVISFLLCMAISPMVNGFISGLKMDDLINIISPACGEPSRNVFRAFPEEMISHIASLPLALVVMPLLFVIVFFLVKLLMLIPHKIVCGAFAFTRKRNNIITRLLGMIVGFAQGVIVTALVLMPVTGAIWSIDASLEEMNKEYSTTINGKAINEIDETFLKGTEKHAILKLSDALTGFIYDGYMNVVLAGEKVDMRDSLTSTMNMLALLGELSESDFNALTPKEQELFSKLTAEIYNDNYLSVVISDLLSGVALAVDSGALEITYDEPVKGFIGELIEVLETSDSDNLGGDVVTIENIYYLMCNTGTMETLEKDPAHVYDKFAEVGSDGTTLFSKLSREFGSNPRMESLSTELTKLSMTLLLAKRGQDMAKTEEAINDVTETLETVTSIKKEDYETEAEYKEAVNSTIDTTLTDHGIHLPEEKVDELSDFVLEELGGKEEITEKDVSDFMVKYYDVYAKAKEEGTLPPGFELPATAG